MNSNKNGDEGIKDEAFRKWKNQQNKEKRSKNKKQMNQIEELDEMDKRLEYEDIQEQLKNPIQFNQSSQVEDKNEESKISLDWLSLNDKQSKNIQNQKNRNEQNSDINSEIDSTSENDQKQEEEENSNEEENSIEEEEENSNEEYEYEQEKSRFQNSNDISQENNLNSITINHIKQNKGNKFEKENLNGNFYIQGDNQIQNRNNNILFKSSDQSICQHEFSYEKRRKESIQGKKKCTSSDDSEEKDSESSVNSNEEEDKCKQNQSDIKQDYYKIDYSNGNISLVENSQDASFQYFQGIQKKNEIELGDSCNDYQRKRIDCDQKIQINDEYQKEKNSFKNSDKQEGALKISKSKDQNNHKNKEKFESQMKKNSSHQNKMGSQLISDKSASQIQKYKESEFDISNSKMNCNEFISSYMNQQNKSKYKKKFIQVHNLTENQVADIDAYQSNLDYRNDMREEQIQNLNRGVRGNRNNDDQQKDRQYDKQRYRNNDNFQHNKNKTNQQNQNYDNNNKNWNERQNGKKDGQQSSKRNYNRYNQERNQNQRECNNERENNNFSENEQNSKLEGKSQENQRINRNNNNRKQNNADEGKIKKNSKNCQNQNNNDDKKSFQKIMKMRIKIKEKKTATSKQIMVKMIP